MTKYPIEVFKNPLTGTIDYAIMYHKNGEYHAYYKNGVPTVDIYNKGQNNEKTKQ